VLRRLERLAFFDDDEAAGMLTWPHSGFHVHTAVWVSENDRASWRDEAPSVAHSIFDSTLRVASA